MNEPTSLTIKRRLKAPPAKVFAAWTSPDLLMRWFGPEGIENVSADCDARVGGAFRIVMRAADGETHEVSGIYQELTRGDRRRSDNHLSQC